MNLLSQFLSSAMLIAAGVLGETARRHFAEQKTRPTVTIRDEAVPMVDPAKATLDRAFKPRDAKGRFQSRKAFIRAALKGEVK